VAATTYNQRSPASGKVCYRMAVTCNSAFSGALNSGSGVTSNVLLRSAVNQVMQAMYNQVCPSSLQNQEVVFFVSNSALDPSGTLSSALSAYNAVATNDLRMCDLANLAQQAFAAAGASVPITACNTDNCNAVQQSPAATFQPAGCRRHGAAGRRRRRRVFLEPRRAC
jgi:hypothetical protein